MEGRKTLPQEAEEAALRRWSHSRPRAPPNKPVNSPPPLVAPGTGRPQGSGSFLSPLFGRLPSLRSGHTNPPRPLDLSPHLRSLGFYQGARPPKADEYLFVMDYGNAGAFPLVTRGLQPTLTQSVSLRERASIALCPSNSYVPTSLDSPVRNRRIDAAVTHGPFRTGGCGFAVCRVKCLLAFELFVESGV